MFKLVSATNLNGHIAVHKYESQRTGLRFVHANVGGPIVNGYFCLATEAHDDDGLPHTLEHLIFLGSEKYPYKGALDLLANRCLASGTNAWTDTDHTCYTMTTAGSEGFMSLLPIYLDHILYPTLSDSGFITEVHHVNGEGKDGGVVYCEMQGRENSDVSRTQLAVVRAMYPGSGYSSETGGIMSNLRTTTTNKKVREYHKQFYRPENLTIIISGQVTMKQVFDCLTKFEDERILPKPRGTCFVRPWQTPVAPLGCSKSLDIVYPSDDEDSGLIYIAWRGPKLVSTEYPLLTACSILLRYLSDTSISPLQQAFVEVKDPLASSVQYYMVENSESLLYLSFENVPLKKMADVHPLLVSVLGDLVGGKIGFDMKRMKNIIEKMILEAYSSLEDNPHDTVAYTVIGDCLYGNSTEDFDTRLNVVREYKVFLTKEKAFWIDLLKKYLVGTHYVLVRARPSIKEKLKMAQEDQERIEEQRKELGPSGLAQKQKELENAIQMNESTIPNQETLTSVPIPDPATIKFHDVDIIRKETEPQLPGFNLNEMQMVTECYSIRTNFVYLIMSLDTSKLENEQRLILPLFLELLMESPMLIGGKLMPYEEVVHQLESDTIVASRRIGLDDNGRFSCGPYSNYVVIMLQVVPENYEKGVEWMKNILFNTSFQTDRIRVCAAKMVNDVAQAKRVGENVLKSLVKCMLFKQNTNVHLSSILMQYRFLTQLLEALESPWGSKAIIDMLNGVRKRLTDLCNITLHMAADFKTLGEKVKDIQKPWKDFLSHDQLGFCERVGAPTSDNELIDAKRKLKNNTLGCVVGVGSVESSFLMQVVPSINNYNDADLPAVMLFLQYVTQLEGSMWRQIRGQGYAYGYSITPRPNEGLLSLVFYKATNVVAAYKETKAILENLLKDGNLDNTLFESARSSLIFEIVERERNIGDLVNQSLLGTFKNVEPGYNQKLVKRIGHVPKASLIEIGRKYVLPLFTDKARTAIVCNPEKAAELAGAFGSMGRPLDIKVSVEESILADGYSFAGFNAPANASGKGN